MKIKDTTGQFFAIKLSLAFGFIMLVIKWYAFIITGSSAILSDAAESIVHIIGVSFAVFSLWLSLQPADEKHTYGHDKITYFSAGVEGSLIVLAAFYIIYVSVRRLIVGVEISNLDKGTYFTFAASVINLFLGLFLVRKGRKNNSLILVANGKHVLTDSWTSFGVVAGLLLTWITGWFPFDPIVAILAALNILWSGGKLMWKSAGGLMDEGDEKVGKIIKGILDEKVKESNLQYHKLRYRESGNVIWVELHLLFPGKIVLEEAHHTATEIENSIKTKLGIKVNITTHLEPIEIHEEVHKEEEEH
jgi:cation diffusion facilitator family transporter